MLERERGERESELESFFVVRVSFLQVGVVVVGLGSHINLAAIFSFLSLNIFCCREGSCFGVYITVMPSHIPYFPGVECIRPRAYRLFFVCELGPKV